MLITLYITYDLPTHLDLNISIVIYWYSIQFRRHWLISKRKEKKKLWKTKWNIKWNEKQKTEKTKKKIINFIMSPNSFKIDTSIFPILLLSLFVAFLKFSSFQHTQKQFRNMRIEFSLRTNHSSTSIRPYVCPNAVQ